MLSGPSQGGAEREKSSVMRSPAIVRSSAIGERLVGDAVIVEEIVAAVGAVGQRRDIRAHQRFGARATARRARP